MGYDLVFWRETPELLLDSQMIYVDLLEGNRVEGLAEIPVQDILAGLREVFPQAEREGLAPDEWIHWVADDHECAVEIYWSPTHVQVVSRGLPTESVNAVIDVMTSHSCPLYDPQTDERFAFDGL